MKLANLGGTGGIGSHLLSCALDAEPSVRALTRHRETLRRDPGLAVFGGDALALGAGRGGRGDRRRNERRGEMHGRTRLALTNQAAADSRREALFASELQPSDGSTGDMITSAITSTIQRFGSRGCTERMAQEFGDHPDVAAERMRWARRAAA
jgi:hypothetical protein